MKWIRYCILKLKPVFGDVLPLEKRFWLGALVMFMALGFQLPLACQKNLWAFDPDKEPSPIDFCLCDDQWASKKRRTHKLEEEITLSRERLAALRAVMINHDHLGIVSARKAFDEEKAIQDLASYQKSRLSVEPLSEAFGWIVGAAIVTLIICLAVARTVSFHFQKAFSRLLGTADPPHATRIFWIFAGCLAFANVMRDVHTSILMKEKTWFGASSFCVCPELWSLGVLAGVGAAFVVAYPLTVLWLAGSPRRLNRPLDPSHVDGQWGMGKVVQFIQTWVFLCVISGAITSAVWLKLMQLSGRGSWQYFSTITLAIVLCLAVSLRFVRAAFVIRIRYQRCLAEMGLTWNELQSKNFPADPTISVLGEAWWKLPAILFGSTAAAWTVFEFFSLTSYIKNMIGF